MKRLIFAALLTACGSASDGDKPATAAAPAGETKEVAPGAAGGKAPVPSLSIANESELPDCGAENQRQLIYVVETADFRVCGEGWQVIEVGKTVVKETKEVEKLVPAEGFGDWEYGEVQLASVFTVTAVTVVELPDARFRVTIKGFGSNYSPTPATVLVQEIDKYETAEFSTTGTATPVKFSIIDWDTMAMRLSYWDAQFPAVTVQLVKN